MTDTTPDRFSLQSMEKKTTETFTEYAHKWRDLAAQVQHPMTDNELNKMFLNTLKASYYDRLIENSNTNFFEVVLVGEMIESGVKLDKIEGIEGMLDEEQEKKKGKKTKKGNIVCITRGLWVTPSKIVKISSSWCKK